MKQIAAVTCTLARSLSPYHGALYRRQDVSQSESFVLDDAFAIGPITGRAWFDNRRAEVEVPRGPYMCLAYLGIVTQFINPLILTRDLGRKCAEGTGQARNSMSREILNLPPRHSARYIRRTRRLPSNYGSETIGSARFPQNLSSSYP